tara:strand:- start:407 stop:916 length:510 start_codon:yes stop_codon:yes gene_type:complete
MTVYLYNRRIDLMHLGRAHNAGDIVIHVPDQNVMCTDDIVEYKRACNCGDGYFFSWETRWTTSPRLTLMPSRPDAALRFWARPWSRPRLKTPTTLSTAPTARVAARNGNLKEVWDAVRAACNPKFSDYAIYEHCLPFNMARAYDEACGIETPRIWTTQPDLDMWDELQA